jgi:outer membrane protein assembly factor BamD
MFRAPTASRGSVARLALLGLLAVALLLGGCRSWRHKEDNLASPEAMYRQATKFADEGSFQAAIKMYEGLNARFPFSDPARQSRLDLVYAYYRQHEKDSAIDAADTFIRENPTHPRIDYAYYMKGLVYFERDPNFLERWFNVDISARPPTDQRKSFDAFTRVVQQYPSSAYAADARQRMIYLRNRLADYEIHVAEYYVRRGAWVAALARARNVIETYDGSPRMRDALEISISCYHKLGLEDLANDTAKVLTTNFPEQRNGADGSKKKHWWSFGRG